MLGDGKTAALVSLRGSIDWMCLPTFDSAACFARLLGTPDNGRWLLTVRDATTVTRRYLDDSFVLETTYETPDGTAVAQETMPLNDGRADLVRRLVCTRGQRRGRARVDRPVRLRRDRAVGAAHHRRRRERRDPGDRRPRLAAAARRPAAHGRTTTGTPTGSRCRQGESVELALTWTRSWDPVPPRLTIADRIDSTRIAWGLWARSCAYQGSYREAVVRSLLVLRLLTDSETGGIVAAATTSLPEDFGGERNWDYRYCWLRDAAMTLEALLEHGYREEATEWRDWLLRAVAGRLVGPADHVPRRRRAGPAGAGARPPGGLRRLTPGPGRERGRRPGAERRARRGDVRPRARARRQGCAETDDSWSLQRHLVDDLLERWRRARTAASGRSAASRGTSRTRR